MKNFNEIKNILTASINNTTAATVTEKVITPSIFERKVAYQTVMANCQRMGSKRFCLIPLELLEVDEEYQRLSTINVNKIYDLERNWDENKCDPILVSPHPETYTFAVIDGTHRFFVKGIFKEEMIVAVIAEGLSQDPTERQVQEAELFSEQDTHNDHLSPADKHRAYVKRGIKKYCVLNECLKGRKLLLSSHELKNLPKAQRDALIADDYRVLTGYSAAVQAAGLVNGKDVLNNIFDIIEKSGWNFGYNGYGAKVIGLMKSVLNMHNNDERVKRALIDYCIHTEPNLYFANALSKYPKRKELEGLIIYMEEEVAKRIGEPPMYKGGDLRKVTSPVNVSHAHEKAM